MSVFVKGVWSIPSVPITLLLHSVSLYKSLCISANQER